ncbi:MAG TPA: ABC transporter permease [Steroidobacteraceae bacterium]|nr:ABC transporter permease [Steroidobacteraceae bacterium]
MLSLRTLHTRIRSSWVIVAALTVVSVVLLSALAVREGIILAYLGVGHADRAIITSMGSVREVGSAIPGSSLGPILDAPGIRKAPDGGPLAEAETYEFYGPLTQRNQDTGATGIRGIGPKGLQISPEIRIAEGRYLRSGTREVLAGVLARQRFAGTELGDRITLLDGGQWTVVGHFSTGTFLDGEFIVDPQVMSSALRRTTYNTVLVSLKSSESLEDLKNALTTNPALSVTVERQSDFWKRQFDNLPVAPLILDYVVSLLLAAGAVSGILHTMHSTVGARAREIAILRTVGFGGYPVAVAIVCEAMLFAGIGAVIGTAIDWLWLNEYPMMAAYGVFRIRVTPHLLGVALGWALATALVGAIVPAVQEARLEVVDALGRV